MVLVVVQLEHLGGVVRLERGEVVGQVGKGVGGHRGLLRGGPVVVPGASVRSFARSVAVASPPMTDHVRRIDRILAPGVPRRARRAQSLDELRAMEREAIEVETEISYVRRLAQGRIDILAAETRPAGRRRRRSAT